MTKPNDGGPASDMTLRDHFAGLAMRGMLTHPELLDADGKIGDKKKYKASVLFAKISYAMADAMIAAREADAK